MTDYDINKDNPTPWSVFTSGDTVGIINRNGVWVRSISRQYWEQNEAELEHICKCVNIHNELVEALEEMEPQSAKNTGNWSDEKMAAYDCGFNECKWAIEDILTRAKDGKDILENSEDAHSDKLRSHLNWRRYEKSDAPD